jgi:hypothetical protein
MSPVFTRNALAGGTGGFPYHGNDPYQQQRAQADDYLRNLYMQDQQSPASGVVAPNSGAYDPMQMQDFNNQLLGGELFTSRRAY